MPAYEQLWAKAMPHKQLIAHMIDAGSCAVAFLQASSSKALRQFLASELSCEEWEAIAFAGYLTALHDIGKASPYFQGRDPEEKERLITAGLSQLFKQ